MNITKDLTNEAWKNGNTKDFVILHHTGSSKRTTHRGIVRFFKRWDYISVHYVVGYNGEVTQLVREDDRAWHAGRSKYQGFRNLNNHSIGIEILSDGTTFTNKQRNAVHDLCRMIMKRNQIPSDRVLRHADVAYPRGRKSDVGKNFYGSRWGDWDGFQCSLDKPDLSVPESIKKGLEVKYAAQSLKVNDSVNNADKEVYKLNKIRRDLATSKGMTYKPHTLSFI